MNEALADTLREPEQRPNFYFYNNGVTLTCSQFRHNALRHGNWQVQMDDLQIVNGGQTARTVQKIMKENCIQFVYQETVIVAWKTIFATLQSVSLK